MQTKYGFKWEQIEVLRIAEFRGSRIVAVQSGKNEVQVIASPTGKSVTVTLNGIRMVPREPETP